MPTGGGGCHPRDRRRRRRVGVEAGVECAGVEDREATGRVESIERREGRVGGRVRAGLGQRRRALRWPSRGQCQPGLTEAAGGGESIRRAHCGTHAIYDQDPAWP